MSDTGIRSDIVSTIILIYNRTVYHDMSGLMHSAKVYNMSDIRSNIPGPCMCICNITLDGIDIAILSRREFLWIASLESQCT